jgi:hypothetical protein
MMGSFYEELERVFHNFSKYHTEILLEILLLKWAGKTFGNQKLEVKAYRK